MPKIAIFYTARMNSTRLPKKMLLKVQGKTVIEHGLARLLEKNKHIPVILCTTFLSDDNALANIAQKMGAQVYRGAVTDVLERYLGAARQFGIDFFVVADGDDLFVEDFYTKKIINTFKKTQADYIYTEGLPYGVYGFGVKVSALEKVCHVKDDKNTEGWGRYFLKTNLFKTKKIQALKKHHHPEYRLTLDYPEDLQMYREIYKNLYKGKYFSIDSLFAFLAKHPKIAQMNWNRVEEYNKRFAKKYSKIILKKKI